MTSRPRAPPPPEPLAVLRGHGVPVHASCFLGPATLASGGADGAVRIWDLRSRRETAAVRTAHSKAGVLHATALAGGARLATQGRDGLVKLWDAARFGDDDSAAPLASYYCGSFSFTKFAALRWSPQPPDAPATEDGDGDLLVCPGPEGSQILVYDWRAARPALQIAVPDAVGSTGKGMCMALSLFAAAGAAPDSDRRTFIAAGFEGGQLALLDLRTGGKIACEAQVTRATDPLLAFDVAQDGRLAVCGSSGTELFVVQLDASALAISARAFFQCSHGGFGAIRIRGDQRVFATAGWDHRVRVFHLRKLKPLAILKHHSESVFGLAFSPDSALLASASKDHKIALWGVFPPDAAAAQRSLRAY